MRKKHAPTGVLIFFLKIIHKKEFGKKLKNGKNGNTALLLWS